jgi:hypothetical protein
MLQSSDEPDRELERRKHRFVLLCLGYRLMRRAFRPEPVPVFGEGWVPSALQNLHHRLLNESIQHRRDAKVLVHRLACLFRASFRPRLATTPLRFTNPSLSSRWVEDFHLQAIGLPGTPITKRHGTKPVSLLFSSDQPEITVRRFSLQISPSTGFARSSA